MNTKNIRNRFLSVGNLFAAAWLLAATILALGASGGTSDGVLNFSNTPLVQPQPIIITFDVPGAGTGPGQGTFPYPINPAGVIAGFYHDASDVRHGFVRARDGTFTTFDPPGSISTTPYSINPEGAINGVYRDASNVFHGFLRARDGTFTTFAVPGGGTGPGQGTTAGNINPAGAIAGWYTDASDVVHGFLRARDGTITTFDVPGAGTGPGQGTYTGLVDCLNPEGLLSGGAYVDPSDVYHGYVRAPDGTITTFDVPGAGTGPFQGTLNAGINQAGTIVGEYIDPSDVNHGHVRAPDQALKARFKHTWA